MATSDIDIDFGTLTNRCPSIVRECAGPQYYDGYNDVGWAQLRRGTLGVTWIGQSATYGYEADMALSTRVNWADNGISHYDVETVILHENGHVLGLGHSNIVGAVMEPDYGGVRQALHADDIKGITYLYDNSVTGVVSGTVSDGVNRLAGAAVVLEGTALQATTGADGSYTIAGVPDPVTYTVTASLSGYDSDSISRLTVSGATAAGELVLTIGVVEEELDCPPKSKSPKCR